MSADTTSVSQPIPVEIEDDAGLGNERLEAVITVMATTLAVLFVSFMAVLMGLA